MFRGRFWSILILATVMIAGCSSMPGLRVLTGQDQQGVNGPSANVTVQSLDLVMADKTGALDPALCEAANRIEAADNLVNIIEVRKNAQTRVLTVSMLLDLSSMDPTTQAGQLQRFSAVRRAFELTWQGVMQPSDGIDQFDILLWAPGQISTLDHGASFVGILRAEGTIDRTAAATYLSGALSDSNFYNLIINGTLNYQVPSQQILYEGTPNHPMFMLPATSNTSASSASSGQ